MFSSQDADQCEAWASQHVEVLQIILEEPLQPRNLSAILPKEGLRVAHVVGIVAMLGKRAWKSHFAGRCKGGQEVALHVWLYHLGGGANSKLSTPTLVKNDSAKVVRPIRSECESYKYKRSKVLATQRSQIELDQLNELVQGVMLPFDCNLLRCSATPRSLANGSDQSTPGTGKRAAHLEQLRLRIDVKRGLYFGVCDDADEERRLRPRIEYKFLCTDTPNLHIGTVLPAAAQYEYVLAKPSNQRGAGEGCFAKKDICGGTVFKLDIDQVMENNTAADELEARGEFFVNFSFRADDDPMTRVLCDGELTTFARVCELLRPDALCDPAVVGMLAPDQLLNKANDLSYTPGMLPDAYESVVSLKLNPGAFVLEVKEGLVTSALVLVTRDVKTGEEFGIGYGYNVWAKHAAMARYVAALSDYEVREMKNLLMSHFSG